MMSVARSPVGKFISGFCISESRRNRMAIGLFMSPPFLLKWFYQGDGK
jgi:hypothetical protein